MMTELTAQDMKPTARAVKDQEMAIRRAHELNAGLLSALGSWGTIEAVISAHRDVILRTKSLKALFPYGTVQYDHKDIWEWTVRHWYSGALKRSVEVSMCNITETNRKNIKAKLESLHG